MVCGMTGRQEGAADVQSYGPVCMFETSRHLLSQFPWKNMHVYNIRAPASSYLAVQQQPGAPTALT
jgi:hypothetical protein